MTFEINQLQRLGIEAALVGIIVILAISLAAKESTIAINKAILTEAFLFSAPLQRDQSIHRALYGTWPAANGLEQKQVIQEKPALIESFKSQAGYVHITLQHEHENLDDKRLSFRAATSREILNGAIMWQCGHTSPPSKHQIFGDNETNMNRELLFNSCKN